MAELLGFSDSDLAGDLDSRKGITGVPSGQSNQLAISKAGGSSTIKLWNWVYHRCYCYMSGFLVVAVASWLSRLLAEILDSVVSKPMLRVDNKSTISLIKTHVHNDRSKHIDAKFYFIRESNVHDDLGWLRWVSSKLMSNLVMFWQSHFARQSSWSSMLRSAYLSL